MKRLLLLFLLIASFGLGARAQSVAERPAGGPDERSIVLFPNPSNGILHVTITGFDKVSSELKVINVIGNVVYRENFNESEPRFSRTVDLSSLAAGLYYVKVESGTHAEMRTVVIR